MRRLRPLAPGQQSVLLDVALRQAGGGRTKSLQGSFVRPAQEDFGAVGRPLGVSSTPHCAHHVNDWRLLGGLGVIG
jgi:hypothetical protein